MSQITFTSSFVGQDGIIPSNAALSTTDNLSTLTALNYLSPSVASQLANTNLVSVAYNCVYNGEGNITSCNISQFQPVITSSGLTLNQIVPAGPAVISDTVTVAAPGTVRALTGAITQTATTQTSGNLVGVRGSVTAVGASGSTFWYGVQGKIIATGTLASSLWAAPVFGQFDLHAATITSGQCAAIWGDYGTTISSGTYTGCRGIAMTNTTAAVLNAQIYLYGGATNLLELDTNSGLIGSTTYYTAAGTSSGSAGNSTHCAAQKVLTFIIDGATCYIPVFTQNT